MFWSHKDKFVFFSPTQDFFEYFRETHMPSTAGSVVENTELKQDTDKSILGE